MQLKYRKVKQFSFYEGIKKRGGLPVWNQGNKEVKKTWILESIEMDCHIGTGFLWNFRLAIIFNNYIYEKITKIIPWITTKTYSNLVISMKVIILIT